MSSFKFGVAALAAASIALSASAGAAADLAGPGLESVLAERGLSHGRLLQLPAEPMPGADYLVPIVLDGTAGLLELSPHSVRGAEFEVLVPVGGGYEPVVAGPVRTMRGRLVGPRPADVAAAITDGGLEGLFLFEDGTRLAIEPVRDLGAAPGLHIVYDPADVIASGHACGVSGDALRISPRSKPGSEGATEGGTIQVAELACDADYEYYLDYGSTGATTARIESVINTMNLQYESEVGIRHELTTIIVRTSSNDPYSSSDAITQLNQFRNHWESSQGSVQRDVAQLFTGKEINGGTIGIAWIGAVCTNYGYGMVQSDFNNNFASATDLSAHELGHNWNADHCNCTSYTMNPYITTANTFSPTFTRGDITSFRDSRSCLTPDGGGGGGGGGGDPVDLPVDGFTTVAGTVASGNTASLSASDNDRLNVDSQKVSNRDRTDLRVTLSGASGASSLDVAVELSLSTTIRTTIYIYNYSSNKWDRAARFNGPSGDTTYTFDGISGASYVSGSGDVQVRIYTNRRNRPHTLRVDHVSVIAIP